MYRKKYESHTHHAYFVYVMVVVEILKEKGMVSDDASSELQTQSTK
jgi:hypothetical protein